MALKAAQVKAKQEKAIAYKRRQEQLALEKEQLREKLEAKLRAVEQRREEIRKRIKEMRALALKKFEASRTTAAAQAKLQVIFPKSIFDSKSFSDRAAIKVLLSIQREENS